MKKTQKNTLKNTLLHAYNIWSHTVFDHQPIGNCRYSDITVFSFHPVKILTSGEGGMVVTNDPELASKMRLLRSHGITRDEAEMTHLVDGPWYYEQIQLGFNYRMTDIQAALGVSQMRRLPEFIETRNRIANKYNALLDECPIQLPYLAPNCYSSFHLYIIRIDSIKNNHKEFFENMRSSGIGINLHYIPVYRQPYYGGMGFSPSDFPESENYYAQAISLPIFSGLTDTQQEQVVKAVNYSLEKSKRL